ncbi:MAG TPA: DUF2169 domain-containing protein [Polyangiaceae bacterium]
MWIVTNRTPYAVGRVWGRTKEGVHEWIVAVKATFDIAPNGTLALADEQEAPLLLPQFHGEDGASSLRYDADLVAPKPTTDVLVNGTAYAPHGRPSSDFFVSLRVDRVHKVVRVLGDRTWEQGVRGARASKPEPILQAPIVYERAYGGWDTTDPDPRRQKMDARNPVGRGVVIDETLRTGRPLHNFEYPDQPPEKAGPAGFGAIAGHWSPRLELQGTYDEEWHARRKPLLPADWDPRSLLSAPPDQQAPTHLRGGETVELVNLTPGGFLKLELPKIYLAFTTRFGLMNGRRSQEHRSRLATVIVEPDRPRLILVWSSSLLCHEQVDYLDETIVQEKAYV